MSQDTKAKISRNRPIGLLGKSLEWYRVYESRMAINLLEPWEKCLANLLVIMVPSTLIYIVCKIIVR